MHTYSMRGCPREHYIFYIALVAISSIAIAKQIAGNFGVIVSVGTVTMFGFLHYFFDHYAWRMPGISRIVAIPDLEGTWQVTGTTDGKDGVAREWKGEARIEQTWSRIAISLETDGSRSRSTMASLERDAGHGFRIIYGYRNEPKGTIEDLHSHYGTCQLVISPTLESAEATYFNDRERRTCGTMNWKRVIENGD
ncbi:MAG: hypothetical protein CME32_27960 [Gimesia sp.]|nr:hypothetical protein [Gimesia sp.]